MKRLLVLMCVVVAGCATAYAPKSFWNDGGFTETEIQPGLWQVRFVGNEFSSKERTADFAMLRASELCINRSSRYMLMGDIATESVQSGYLPSTTYTTATAYGYGNVATGTAVTTTIPGAAMYSPETGLTVACGSSQTEKGWDAAFLANSVRSKYNLPRKSYYLPDAIESADDDSLRELEQESQEDADEFKKRR